jgi:hypothetical protein
MKADSQFRRSSRRAFLGRSGAGMGLVALSSVLGCNLRLIQVQDNVV